MTPEELRKAGEQLATTIGTALRQNYVQKDGEWWLCTFGKPVRTLRPDEVAWHVARRHKPFVPDGIDTDSPDWWKEPE